MERVLEQSSETPRLTLLDLPGTKVRAFGEDHDDAHDHDDHSHDEAHGHDEHGHDERAHDEHGHDHNGIDPHAWLDPANARHWLGEIVRILGDADPENAALCAANAQAASDRIGALEATLKARIAPVAARPIVVFHDAYGYFAEAFGVTTAGSIALGDTAAPGAQGLVELRETIEHDGVDCLFREPQNNPALGTLDPLGARLEAGPHFYDRLVTALADDTLTYLRQCA